MKLYKLYLAKPLLVFYLFMLAAWVFAGLIGIILGAMAKFGSDGPPVCAFVIWLCGALFVAYMWLRIPFEIKIDDANMIEFRSILRRATVSPHEIKSVRAKLFFFGFVDIPPQPPLFPLLSHID